MADLQHLFAKVPLAVIQDLRLSSADVRSYAALATFGGYETIRPSVPEIARRGALTERCVRKSLSWLRELGHIGIERGGGRGHANTYTLGNPEQENPVSESPVSHSLNTEARKGERRSTKGGTKRPRIKGIRRREEEKKKKPGCEYAAEYAAYLDR